MMRQVSMAFMVVLTVLVPLRSAPATPYYWDIDQATPGAGGGASPSGTWSTTDTTLSTDSTGSSAVVAHTTGTGDSVTFSAGATATGGYNVAVSGTQNIGTLTFEDGLPSLTGGTLNMNNGAGTGTFNVNVNTDIAGVIGGANLVKNGTSTMTWSGTGTNTYTASLTVTAGTLNLKGTHTDDGIGRQLILQGTSTVNLEAGATETQTGSSQLNMGNSLAGTQNFNIAGTLNLNGTGGSIIAQNAASLTSTLTVQNGGVLSVSNASNFILGNNNATASGILTVQTGGSVTINSSVAAISLGRSGATGTINLDGGTFSTGLTILGSNFGATGTAIVNFNGGTLKAITANNANWVNPSSTGGTGRANVRDGGAKFDTNGLSMGISQALLHSNIGGDAGTDGGLTLNDTSATPGTLTLSGANTYTGATTVSAGTLKAGVLSVPNVSGAFGNNSAVSMANVAGATLDITGFNTQIGSLTGGGALGGNVTLGAATLTVGGDNTSPAAYAGAISGTGALIKIGTGTQGLSGTNTYSGATTVNAGTLQLLALGSLQNSAVNVNTGTFLQTGGTNNVTGGVGTGNLNIATGAVYTLSGGILDFHDTLAASGHHAGGTASEINLTGTAAFNFSGGGTLQDVSTINTAGLTGMFTQSGGRFFIGQDEPGLAGTADPANNPSLPDIYARTTTINGGFSLLQGGTVYFDAFGPEATPLDYSNAEPIDLLRVTGAANLNGIFDFDDEYGAEFGDIHTLMLAQSIGLGPNFAIDGGFFRVVPTGLGPGFPQFALQAIVPEPASVAMWMMIGLVGAGGAWRMRRNRKELRTK